ncbi:hypothetical protein D3C86_622670 [compost metagenome]
MRQVQATSGKAQVLARKARAGVDDGAGSKRQTARLLKRAVAIHACHEAAGVAQQPRRGDEQVASRQDRTRVQQGLPCAQASAFLRRNHAGVRQRTARLQFQGSA